MYLRKIALAVALALPFLAGADDLFRLSFHGTARSGSDTNRLNSRHINTRDLIARCAGQAALDKTNHDYELVYNATADSVQIVQASNGELLCDLLQFQGVVTNSDGRRQDRLSFVFVPEETNSVGSALIRDKINHKSDRLSLHGQIQFAMASLEPGSVANTNTTGGTVVTVPDTNVTTISVPGTNVTTLPTVPSVIVTNSAGTNVSTLPSFPGSTNSTSAIPIAGTNATTLPSFPATPTNSVSATNAGVSTNVNTLPSFPAPQTNSVSVTNSTAALAVPGLPSVSTVTDINTNSLTGSTSTANTTIATPIVLPMADTNLLIVSSTTTADTSHLEAAFATNQVPLLSFSNAVICSELLPRAEGSAGHNSNSLPPFS